MFVSEEENEKSKMFLRFEPTKSTKGASKMRRDLINAEISNLRDLLPLPPSTRQRLSQLQLMALVCVYVRKMNYFQQVLKCHDFTARYREHSSPTANIGFSKAINGFMMMMTQNGKLLYISENAAEYLGHSMEDLLIHGDSVYDIIDRQDHQTVQNELNKSSRNGQPEDLLKTRTFFCRMNVTRNARRQMRFGDQKVVLVRGHFVSYLPLCSRNEPVFLAACTPLAMPETRECVVHGATNVFTTIHAMDMKIIHVDKNGEWYLGWQKSELQDVSWYHLIHWENLREAQNKHKLITHSEQEKSSIMLLRMQTKSGEWIWIHAVLQVKENNESNQTIIVCTNQVLSEAEAEIMTTNSWLYHYYSVQNKPNFGLAFDAQYQKYCPNGTYFESSPSQFNGQDPYVYEAGSCEHTPHPQHRMEASTEVPSFQESPQCVEDFARHPANPLNGEGVPQYLNEERAQNFDRGPVDYSTHSPTSVTSGERSPTQYEYPHEEMAALGQVLYFPVRQGEKRKHDQLHPRPETYPQTLQIYYDVKPSNTTSVTSHHVEARKVHIRNGLPAPIIVNGDPADCIDRWNPSPPWSDSALHKMAESNQRFCYSHALNTPLTPAEHLPHYVGVE